MKDCELSESKNSQKEKWSYPDNLYVYQCGVYQTLDLNIYIERGRVIV